MIKRAVLDLPKKQSIDKSKHHINAEDKRIAIIGNGEMPLYLIDCLFGKNVNVTHFITSDPVNSPLKGVEIKLISVGRSLSRCLDSLDNKVDHFFVAFYDRKISKPIIDKYQEGHRLLNLHASWLPFYRGPNPIEDMLSDGLDIGGVTIHEVDYDFDTGPILGRKSFEFVDSHAGKPSKKTIDQNYMLAVEKGAWLFNYLLSEIENIRPLNQDEAIRDAFHRMIFNSRIICTGRDRKTLELKRGYKQKN